MKTYKRQYLAFALPTDRLPADAQLSEDPLSPQEWDYIAACPRHGDTAEHEGDIGVDYACTCIVGTGVAL